MKKTKLLLILFALLPFGQTAWAQSQINVINESELRSYLTNQQYDGYTFNLTNNITIPSANGELEVRYRATINMNGKTIMPENASIRIFHIYPQGDSHFTPSLTLTGNGTLSGGSADNGGAIYNEGSLTIQNVTIQNCTASAKGGAIYSKGSLTMSGGSITSNTAGNAAGIHLESGSFTMTGGSISGNNTIESGDANKNCGGVNITNYATMMMSGGSIANNTSLNNDGGIYIGGNATLTLTGGSITGNTASAGSRGGGISVNGGTLNMSGNPVVSGNTANGNSSNVYLPSSKTITVNGAFTDGANVYVKTESDATRAITNGYSTNNASIDPSTVFHTDNNIYGVGLIENEAYTYQSQWTSGSTTCTFVLSTGVLTVSGNGAMADYTYQSLPGWYSLRDYITQVVVEEGVTAIGAYAFNECTAVVTVTIPSTMTMIGDYAFYQCTGTTDVYFHENLQAANLTWTCTQGSFKTDGSTLCHVHPLQLDAYVTKFHQANVTFVGDQGYPFSWPSGATIATLTVDGTLTITPIPSPSGGWYYGQMSGYNSTDPGPWNDFRALITRVVFADGTYNVGSSAFENYTNLTSLDLGTTVQKIYTSSFEGTSLASVTIPNRVEEIWNDAFGNCSSLRTIHIESEAISIDENAFRNTTNVDNIYMYSLNPESITWGSSSTCFKSSQGTVCHVPAHRYQRYYDRFNYTNGTHSHINVTFQGDIYPCVWESGYITCTLASDGSFTLSGTGAMADYASADAQPWFTDGVKDQIASIVIGDNVTGIGAYALANCTTPTSLTIPSSVTNIGAHAFDGCTSIAQIYCHPDANDLTWDDATASFMSNHATQCHVYGTQLGGYHAKFPTVNVSFDGINMGYPYAWVTGDCVTMLAAADANEFTIHRIPNYGTGAMPDYQEHNDLFAYANQITTLTVNDGVTSIGTHAFDDFTQLSTVTLSNSVTSVGDYAFHGCTSLSNLTFGSGLTTIGDYAFQGCSSLVTLSLPNSLTALGEYTFQSCTSLANITFGSGLTAISDYAFQGCTAIGAVSLPNNIATIGDYVFQGCTSLTDLTLTGVTTLGTNAFQDCTALANVNLGSSLTTIGDHAFDGCTDLATLTFLENATLSTIGQYAFYNCGSLTTFTIPGSVTNIGIGAFHRCSSITDVYCWPEANNLEWVADVDAATSRWVDVDLFKPGFQTKLHILVNQYDAYFDKFKVDRYNDDHSVLNVTYSSDLGNFPYTWTQTHVTCTLYADGSFTVIGTGAMDDPESHEASYEDPGTGEIIHYTAWDHQKWYNFKHYIQTVTVGEGVTSISKFAFEQSNLSSVSLPSTLTLIDDNAFSYCAQLTAINIPAAVTTIGEGAFAATGIASVTIPSGVTAIADETFSGCHDLATVSLPSIVTTIGNNAFDDCNALTDITLPSRLTSIGDDAFSSCGFSSINLPNGLTSIGDRAFHGTPLTSVTIPGTVTTLGSNIFGNCQSLVSATFAEGCTTVGKSMFERTTISIGGYSYNSALTTVNLPNSLTTIGESAFSGCNLLETITIPANVTLIDSHAFGGCTGMTDVVCYPNPANLTWNNGAYSFKEDQTTQIHVFQPYLSEYQSKFAYNSGTATGVRATFVGDLTANIILYADQDNTAALASWNGVNANVTLEGVTFRKNGEWNVFTLPFTISAGASIFNDALDYKQLNQTSSYNNGELTINLKAVSTFTAGTPYLVKWDSGDDIVNPIFENVVISEATASSVNNTNNNVHFHGSFAPTNLTIGSTQNLYVGTDGKLHLPAQGCNTVNAFAGYFTVDGDVSSYNFAGKSGRFYIFETIGDWNTATNWSTYTVPPAGSDVIIQDDVTISSGTVDAGNIVVMGDKTLTIADGAQLKHTSKVPGKIQKSIKGYGNDPDVQNGWYLLGAPIKMDSALAVNSGMVDFANGHTDFTTHGIDLYHFNQNKDLEWENMRTGNRMYYMALNVNHAYLYARANDATLNFSTKDDKLFAPTSNDSLITVTRNSNGVELAGYNLISNPYTCNAYLVSGRDFWRMNTTGDAIVLATEKAIKPCEGVFVVVAAENDPDPYTAGSIVIPNMAKIRITTTEPAPAGGAKGMMDITVKQEGQLADVARVRFGEGDRISKFVFREEATRLSIPQDGKDYSVVHHDALGEMPLNFKAKENGQYTISVNPESVEMAYLHLIDNLTGANVDLLDTPSYTFEGKTTDYASRFKLLFVANNAQIGGEGSEDFAFISNGQLIVTGITDNSVLQIIDITGRVLSSRNASNYINIDGLTPGVYVLRLINGENIKTQKIVVK